MARGRGAKRPEPRVDKKILLTFFTSIRCLAELLGNEVGDNDNVHQCYSTDDITVDEKYVSPYLEVHPRKTFNNLCQ